jgi:isopentenyl-diphosphate delta-isomerase
MIDETKVILVDESDRETGVMDKMEAHRKAVLHRAISVFITDEEGRWLMQQRHVGKYHSRELWSNACCSHPAPGENTPDAAHRRLMQEMGLTSRLSKLFVFKYMAPMEDDLTEHEVDHVFWGISNEPPLPHPEEVQDYRYMSFAEIEHDIQLNPQHYTEWFKMIYKNVQDLIQKQLSNVEG